MNRYRTALRSFAYVVALGIFVGGPNYPTVHAEPYREDWESLTKHPVPEWFKDAKFGIYTHWGVYAVPAFGSEWYPRNMYREGDAAYKHHRETWGDQSEFGYKDFIGLFKAEKFDAEEWAALFAEAGAKFAGPVAEHHDGFSMWASQVNRWNAGDMGPKRDVTGELVRALRKRDIKIITSFHHAFNIQGYYTAEEGWDTGDPKYGDLYGKFDDPKVAHDRWLAKIKEVIDRYQPDQIWYDFGLAKIPDEYKQKMAAYYYNREDAWGKPVIITRKGDHLPEGVGVLDIERGKMEGPAEFLWQTDDSVAVNSWGWVKDLRLKPVGELIHELIDIVSKNGVLLLNVAPKADGTIPQDQKDLLLEMGRWLKVNGEAIYGTRPWKIHGEGPSLFDKGRGFTGPAAQFTARDIRFTRKGDVLYAICLGRPQGEVAFDWLLVKRTRPNATVTMLGHDGTLRFTVDNEKLSVEVPGGRLGRYAVTFKLSGFELDVDPVATIDPRGLLNLSAEKAVLEGDQIALETRIEGRPNLGFWDNPEEKVHWLAKIPKAGTYVVRGEFATAAPSELTFEAAGESITARVPGTGGWTNTKIVELGHIKFDEPGVYHATLRAASPTTWRAVNLWQLLLRPAK